MDPPPDFMHHPPTAPDPLPTGLSFVPPRAAGPRALSPARLARLADPEWLPFVAVMLAPAAAALLLGRPHFAGFLAGAGIYLASLKWLGWLALPPAPAYPLRLARFPAEVLTGLALATAWFYVRALAGRLLPGTFGLGGLRLLPAALAALHLLALLTPGPVPATMTFLRQFVAPARLATYGTFAVLLALALVLVGSGPGVHSSDALVHAYTTQAFLQHGPDFSLPRTGQPFTYPAGFGALTAAAAALAPLTPAGAVNLLPVLLGLTALCLIAGTVNRLAGRFWPALFVAVAGLAVLFPVYALFPDAGHNGEPRQAAPGLLAALALLPLAAGPDRRYGGGLLAASLGLLAALACALNPSCAPFAVLAWGLGSVTFLGQAWAAGGPRPFARAAAGLLALTLAAFALVLGQDPFYRLLLRQAYRDYVLSSRAAPAVDARPIEPAPPPVPAPGHRPPTWADAVRATLSPPPWAFSPSVSANIDPDSIRGHLAGWPQRWPFKAVPPLTAALAAGVAWVAFRYRRPWPDGVRPLLALALGGLTAWLLFRAAARSLATLVDPAASWQRRLLGTYLGFMLIRVEVLVVVVVALAAAAAGWLLVQSRRHGDSRPRFRSAYFLGLLAAAGLLWLAGWGFVSPCGTFFVPPNDLMAVSDDDLRLVAWCDEHLPPSAGDIAVAADSASPEGERYLYGLGGAQAFQLLGRSGNYRFVHTFLEGPDAHDHYVNHVLRGPDVPWCLAHNIRYFYIGPQRLKSNRPLHQAVGDGRIVEVHRSGKSAVYALRPAP